jgi:class 3 adenylate cyclase
MEPRIQYAQTADGVSIAFSTLGEGYPFVFMPPVYWHQQRIWEFREITSFLERLAREFRVVLYDGRGTGLSDRNVEDLSVLARAQDLEAVVNRLNLRAFVLFAWSGFGPAGIAYAARSPRKVRKLILYGTYARSSSVRRSQTKPFIDFVKANWEFGTRTLALLTNPRLHSELAEAIGRFYKETASLEYTLQTLTEITERVDVAHLLQGLTMPTLVLHRSGARGIPFEAGRELASLLPNARLTVLDGDSDEPFFGDAESVLQAIDEFLADERELKPHTRRRRPRSAEPAPVTILFTDVEGSTALTQRLGDGKAREVLRAHERIVREALNAHGGSEVKTMGDGFMASFSSATRALECATAMQRAFAAHNETAGEPIRVRIGLNAGEPIAEEKDLFGTAVNMAARIAAEADGGEILASDVVRQLVAGKGFLFSDRGEVELKGFEEPVRLYEVRWQEPT